MTLPRDALALSLQLADRRHRGVLPRHRVARWLRAALDAPAEIAVRVVDEDEGLRLNAGFRGQDHATNVLTFPYDDGPRVVADLVLCAPVIAREAAAAGIPLAAHYAHLVVHGALHAQGHDHLDDSGAEAMEARETAILAGLGIADPYRVASRTPSPLGASLLVSRPADPPVDRPADPRAGRPPVRRSRRPARGRARSRPR